jgi:hypothetical protein
MSEDPNKDRNDPMVPEFWCLGEDLQDKIRAIGYDSPTVDGIAVDIHDLLQSATRIGEELASAIVATPLADRQKLVDQLRELRYEFRHIGWHCEDAAQYLSSALDQFGEGS